ncbi:fungal-specific transcription factor domain-containing protein [Annulohypoxylon maeteangense]|uniref:fungal-specific transcription factor domain-containing protein n=1 Tax=Annulohypoxylon maeteangense TaxID=1927788 RepID=UPI0020089A9E|nr:fungal-specific transcription factor domain-containing protein [Annulohypoxylon maeteangense]KAI0885456.1 fungal-specific transcription factor domain-containing protein [Annulohypoxylon maeteangense]
MEMDLTFYEVKDISDSDSDRTLPKNLREASTVVLQSIENDAAERYSENSSMQSQRGSDCSLPSDDTHNATPIPFGRSETLAANYYIEYGIPFLYPCYRSNPIQGGKSWILDMAMNNPLLRQVIVCQGSYFFGLIGSWADNNALYETAVTQMSQGATILTQGPDVFISTGIQDRLPEAVHTMTAIMQMQRFSAATQRFSKCQSYLDIARTIFKAVLGTATYGLENPRSSFEAVIDRLGPGSHIVPSQIFPVSSPDQAGFRFSTILLIFDDIIASTVRNEKPTLYEYIPSILGHKDDPYPPIDFSGVVGCRNWVLVQIAEISMLKAWKYQCKRAGIIDHEERVRRVTEIRKALELYLYDLKKEVKTIKSGEDMMPEIFITETLQTISIQTSLITQVWCHAALLYLSLVAEDDGPSGIPKQVHVGNIIALLYLEISPKTRIRTMAWPFYVAGCLSQPERRWSMRETVAMLQPLNAFGTIQLAFDIMESVWQNGGAKPNASEDDLSDWFTNTDNVTALLV